jgi:hypothetical protein
MKNKKERLTPLFLFAKTGTFPPQDAHPMIPAKPVSPSCFSDNFRVKLNLASPKYKLGEAYLYGSKLPLEKAL